MEYRKEHDSMGEVLVPADAYWGAATERSLKYFKIGTEKMPAQLIRAFAQIKRAAAEVNFSLGRLDDERRRLIAEVCDEIETGGLSDQFPLSLWQTGSGTQTNMNINEVIANRANELVGKKLLHPNDHVNMSQSSNDTFPTAMHIAAVSAIEDSLLPALSALISEFSRLEDENRGVVKSGRTHLQDATPIAFSQEISGWRSMLKADLEAIKLSLPGLLELALGGTAVGTGLNAPKGFAEQSAAELSRLTGRKFVSAKNKFSALTSKNALVLTHGALKALAADLMKIANDIRWLASGPRCGLGEIFIPENEPGSSIMPGKVNPTQCEAMSMVTVQVMANDVALGIAASQGNFQLNVYMPVIIYNFLQSVGLLSDCIVSFTQNCISGIKPNRERMRQNLHNSLMLVTALSPHIGYERAASVAKVAHEKNLSLKEACLSLGYLEGDTFDKIFRPEEMI